MIPDPHRCVVCGTALPAMTRAEALEKGAAIEHNGLTYYVCAGTRHHHDDILRAITSVPKFRRASKAGGQ